MGKLYGYLSQSPHERAATAKLIHRWIPTQKFLHQQQRETSALCPRCQHHHEDTSHIYQCQDVNSVTSREEILYKALSMLEKHNTSHMILHTFESHLTDLFKIKKKNKFKQEHEPSYEEPTAVATRHQNILGWDNFIRGYISKKWLYANQRMTAQKTKSTGKKWNIIVTQVILDMHHEIWKSRSESVHGKTKKEARERARAAIERQVKVIYQTPPKLALRFPKITEVPLEIRLRKTTNQLQDWIQRIKHQQKVTNIINSARPPGQLTLRQAFANATRQRSHAHDYPP